MFRLLTIFLTVFIVSCDTQDYEVISIQDKTTQFVATVYTRDTNWTKMEQFAKKLIDTRQNKSSTKCMVGFYSNKDKAPKFDGEGNPIVGSTDDVTGHLKYLVAVYDPDDGLEKISPTK